MDWVVVKRVCSHFDKQREWNSEVSSLTGPTTRGITREVPTQSDETRRRLESSSVPTNVVEGPSGHDTRSLRRWCVIFISLRLGGMARANRVTDAHPMTLGVCGATMSATFREIVLSLSRL